uniref:Uncharacterized protein n=1 Tax=Acrobeloides nanus TaxID=290746 RepID=A0A914D920_9BILA
MLRGVLLIFVLNFLGVFGRQCHTGINDMNSVISCPTNENYCIRFIPLNTTLIYRGCAEGICNSAGCYNVNSGAMGPGQVCCCNSDQCNMNCRCDGKNSALALVYNFPQIISTVFMAIMIWK